VGGAVSPAAARRARLMLWWLDPLKKRRLATLAGAFVVVVWGVNWIAFGERPLCGWNGVFGEIAWCPPPTAHERHFEARRRELEDPLEQAILRLGWTELAHACCQRPR